MTLPWNLSQGQAHSQVTIQLWVGKWHDLKSTPNSAAAPPLRLQVLESAGLFLYTS